jgi:methylphosphotriester-DNA--protein-cysteine methyltransferase
MTRVRRGRRGRAPTPARGVRERGDDGEQGRVGVTHSALADDVRRNFALEYLADASISATEIAYRLHFADAAAFYRGFKRWTGESPAAYRRRLF